MPTTNSRPPQKKRDTLSISQLNRQAKRLLEGNFPSVWVEGEIASLAQPSSGHWYFSLKDNSAQVRCAMFRASNSRLRFQVEAGQQVMARAKLSLYEARGDYQLIVEHMEPAGDGALAKAFEALKNKLQQEGLFAPENKKLLPTISRHIAVITSPTGAAIHDILTVLSRRFPATKVTIIPTAVQGKTAATEIASALNKANELAAEDKRFDFDVILCGRGGGSMEDLWAFNEEVVARAIYNSDLPVISAVGHEVDFTIADFVADERAATPSAAAELLSPDSSEMMASYIGYEQWLVSKLQSLLENLQKQLNWSRSRLRHPGSRLQEHSQRLDELELRLINSWNNRNNRENLNISVLNARLQQQTPIHRISQSKSTINNLYRQLLQQMEHRLQKSQQQLASNLHLLETVSPLATLQRGYSIVTDDSGQVLVDTASISAGQTIHTRLAKGSIISKVLKTNSSEEAS